MAGCKRVAGRSPDAINVKRVFGDPIETEGVTVIPAAKVGGGGGGGGDNENNGGGGFGLGARPVGAYVIKGDDAAGAVLSSKPLRGPGIEPKDLIDPTAGLDGSRSLAWLASTITALYFPINAARARIRCATARSTTSRRAARSPVSWRAPTSAAASGKRRPASTPRSAASARSRSSSPTARTASSTRSASTACAPSRSYGRVVWGARTLRGADQLGRRVEVHAGAAHSRSSSRRACIAARNGWCSSPTTSRCGRRSG